MSPSLGSRLERLKGILVCPDCRSELAFESNAAACRICAKRYEIRAGKIYFDQVPDRADELDQLKARLKKWLGKYYYTIGVDIISPDFPVNYRNLILERVNPEQQIVVDVGCGNRRVHEDIICLDLFDYEEVDIVCDASKLPFAVQSVDGLVTRYLLEHALDPALIVTGFHDCTRPGGMGLHLVPFLYPFHASPHDYHRYTHKGIELLFHEWELVEQRSVTGPATLLLLGITEFLSIFLSFGNVKLRKYIYLGLCLLLFPVKYLDIFFVAKKRYITLAPTLMTVVRKPQGSKTDKFG